MKRNGDGRDSEVGLAEQQEAKRYGHAQRQEHGKSDRVAAMPVGTSRFNGPMNGVFHVGLALIPRAKPTHNAQLNSLRPTSDYFGRTGDVIDYSHWRRKRVAVRGRI